MLKTALIIFLIAFSFSELLAQVGKNDIVLNIGGYSGYGNAENEPFLENSGIPALSAGAEYFVTDYFAVGSYITYTYSYDKFVGTDTRYKDVWRGWDIGIKPTIHIVPLFKNSSEGKIDIYISAFAGYTYRELKYDRSNIYRDELNYSKDGLGAGGILGTRYFVSSKIGVYGELGRSKKWFAGAGVVLRME